jgi:drug/metabolite transporter (DMT)-like permease
MKRSETAGEGRDEPMRGIPLLLASVSLFSVADGLTKRLGETLPAVELAWLRYAITLVIASILLLRASGRGLLRSRAPGLQVLRGLGIVASALMFITGLQHLPLAEATAINFVSPAFVTVLSVVFLGERAGWRRWSAIGVGMLGMLIILRPGGDAFTLAALFPIGSAVAWASAVTVTRRIGAVDAPETTLFWTAAVGFIVVTLLLPLLMLFGPAGVTLPSMEQIGLGSRALLLHPAADLRPSRRGDVRPCARWMDAARRHRDRRERPLHGASGTGARAGRLSRGAAGCGGAGRGTAQGVWADIPYPLTGARPRPVHAGPGAACGSSLCGAPDVPPKRQTRTWVP